MKRTKIPFQPVYPDVLGAITGGPRLNIDDLELAIGMYPRVAYINQPIEVVLALQNMVDQPMQLKVAIRLPTIDRAGNVAVIETPRAQVAITLGPGEAGVLRMPVVARAPTHPGKDFPVRVAVRYRVPTPGRKIRPTGGGAPPTVLSVSPFKLQVLKEIEYTAQKWNESADILTVYFDLAPRKMPVTSEELAPRYETLWSQEELEEETKLAMAYFEEAQIIAKSNAYGSAYLSLLDAVEERFAVRGMPLHPGEAKAIAKMMTYTVDEGPVTEPDIVIENTRWFRQLCQILAHDPALLDHDRNDLISRYCFEGVLYEAILLGFSILQMRVKENLGDMAERLNYASKVLAWFAGHGEADLSYVYLPLVLCGLVVSRMVRHSGMENPWDIADELNEAYNGRARLISGAASAVFDILSDLLEQYERALRSQRIERPKR